MENKNENLISIEEIIRRAKELGVDFGKGDPKNRLRYYTKIGLLPHAQRASFGGRPPTGAYPEYVISILVSIDKKLKEGKSILQIKRELGKERAERKEEISPFRFETEKLSEISPFEIAKKEIKFVKKRKIDFKKIFRKSVFWILFSVSLVSFLSILFAKNGKNFLSSMMATILQRQFAQLTPTERPERALVFPYVEPYLTINADTQLNGGLSIRDSLSFQREGYKAMFDFETLTADRTYTFPNASGIVCLTSGNCFGIFGEVITRGGTANRISKFVGPTEIANSSISDFYTGGVSIAISDTGNVGIGTETPRYKLHVIGKIQATDDICTDLAGGKCLSQLITRFFVPAPPPAGVSGSGITGTLALWTSPAAIGSSIIYQSDGKIGIGTSIPEQKLDVAGTIRVLGFQLATTTQAGWVLTSDASGFGTWQPAPLLPEGTLAGQTIRYDGTNWIANEFLFNTGSAIGIGTTSLDPSAILTIAGPIVLSTTTLPQFILKFGNTNFLRFDVDSNFATITASTTLAFDTQTGEIKFWNTSIKKGDLILRSSIPIFKYPVPAQTTSTDFVTTTKEISTSTLANSLPPIFEGAQRKFGFLINFADDIPTDASSTWQIDFETQQDVDFEFPGQNLSQLDEGVPHLKSDVSGLLDDNWILKVKVPSNQNKIRIFSIFLLVFDQMQ